MSIEMVNGTFTSPEVFDDDLIDRFKKLANEGEARALHVGTWEELNIKTGARKKEEEDIQAQMNELREKVEMFEKREISPIKFPTFDEIEKFAGKK